jgi:hypothetical protein
MLGGMRVYSGLRISKKAQYKNKSLRGNKREKKRKKALSGTPTPELSPESMVGPQKEAQRRRTRSLDWHIQLTCLSLRRPRPPRGGLLPPWRPARARVPGSRPARRNSPGWTCRRARRCRLGPCTSASRSRLLRWWARGRWWEVREGRRRRRYRRRAREMGEGRRCRCRQNQSPTDPVCKGLAMVALRRVWLRCWWWYPRRRWHLRRRERCHESAEWRTLRGGSGVVFGRW